MHTLSIRLDDSIYEHFKEFLKFYPQNRLSIIDDGRFKKTLKPLIGKSTQRLEISMYEIEFSKYFVKQIDKLSQNVVKRFYDDLKYICENPLPSNPHVDVKKLQAQTNQYRFLYTIIDEKVIVYFYDLGSRGDIYK
ncbi:MAG: type II toxin-antitoxin system RelE/ParE family toxin [Campylobacteraceae bacterium]|nr:type II toxin-antitoxin system RelE/ParE family toxin [Campylobacteraceae bacterium]